MEEMEKNVKEQQEKMVLENQMHQATADQCKLLKEENDRSAPIHLAETVETILHICMHTDGTDRKSVV